MFDLTVQRHRQRLGLTQEELAERAGVGLRTVRDIETGRTRRARPSTVRRLAVVFDLKGAELAAFHEISSRGDLEVARPGGADREERLAESYRHRRQVAERIRQLHASLDLIASEVDGYEL